VLLSSRACITLRHSRRAAFTCVVIQILDVSLSYPSSRLTPYHCTASIAHSTLNDTSEVSQLSILKRKTFQPFDDGGRNEKDENRDSEESDLEAQLRREVGSDGCEIRMSSWPGRLSTHPSLLGQGTSITKPIQMMPKVSSRADAQFNPSLELISPQ
jgi:hypothetical protein